MSQIMGIVDGQNLSIKQDLIASGTHNYLTAEFSFSPEWCGLSKSAVFTKKKVGFERPLIDNKIGEDQSINLSAGVWKISLRGTLVNDEGEIVKLITTIEQDIVVRKSSDYDESFTPPHPNS